MAGAACGASGPTFAWQVQHFDSLGCAGTRLAGQHLIGISMAHITATPGLWIGALLLFGGAVRARKLVDTGEL